MSAINTCTSEDGTAAYMIADTAVYYIRGEDAGVIESFHRKVKTPSHLKMAIASCGAPEISDLFADECARFPTFDDAVRELPGCAREMAAAGYFTRVFDDPQDDANHFRLLIAGWSEEKRRPQIFAMQSRTAPSGAGAAWAPFSMQGGQRILVQPGAGNLMQGLQSMGYVNGGQVRYRDPGAFLTDLIDWQRRNARFPTVADNFCIGGEAVLTRIDSGGVTETVVRKWENDRVGERIDPSKDAPVSKAPLPSFDGLSRLQRERMEKKARKGTLRAV